MSFRYTPASAVRCYPTNFGDPVLWITTVAERPSSNGFHRGPIPVTCWQSWIESPPSQLRTKLEEFAYRNSCLTSDTGQSIGRKQSMVWSPESKNTEKPGVGAIHTKARINFTDIESFSHLVRSKIRIARVRVDR